MLPREIQAEHWPDRTTYDFPARPIGAARYAGLGLIGFAVLFAWAPARQVAQSLRRALEGGAGASDLASGLFMLVFVFAALVPFGLGLFILAGRTRLTVARDRLTVTEIAGPIRWSRRFRFSHVERLEVASGLSHKSAESAPPPATRLGGLTAALKGGRKRLLLMGYPRDWLDSVAEEISGLMRLQGAAVSVSEVPSFHAPAPPVPADVAEKPAQSNATLTETPGGMELTVPPRGFFKESHGLIFFSTLWCLVLAAITGAVIFGGNTNAGRGSSTPIGAVLFLLVFWAVGAGMFLLGVHLGTRRWTLLADSQSLRVSLRSALRSRQWQWTRSNVAHIRVGNSGVEVNDRPVPELQIHPVAGKKIGLLASRDRAELAWIATILRRALQVES